MRVDRSKGICSNEQQIVLLSSFPQQHGSRVHLYKVDALDRIRDRVVYPHICPHVFGICLGHEMRDEGTSLIVGKNHDQLGSHILCPSDCTSLKKKSMEPAFTRRPREDVVTGADHYILHLRKPQTVEDTCVWQVSPTGFWKFKVY